MIYEGNKVQIVSKLKMRHNYVNLSPFCVDFIRQKSADEYKGEMYL